MEFEDFFKAVEDLKLSKKEFSDVHGGYRLSDKDFVIADLRPAKYGVRLYVGRDGLTHPIRIQSKQDLEKATKILRALLYGRKTKNGKISYKNGELSTDSKKEFIEYLIKKEF